MKDKMKDKLLLLLTILIFPMGIMCLYDLFYAVQRASSTSEIMICIIATILVIVGVISSLRCSCAIYRDRMK
jgi:uncharacterized membrane protein YczE